MFSEYSDSFSYFFGHFLLSTPCLGDIRKSTKHVHKSNFAFDFQSYLPTSDENDQKIPLSLKYFPRNTLCRHRTRKCLRKQQLIFPIIPILQFQSLLSIFSLSPVYDIYWYLLSFPNSKCKSCSVRKFFYSQINLVFKSYTGVTYL